MLAIADACEEQGETHLAAGWRWLAARRRYPLLSHSDHCRWARSFSHRTPQSAWSLPNPVWAAFPGGERYGAAPYWPTCSQALAAAAQALATLHERGEDLEALR